MRNSYKRLGAYIRQVNQRNKNLISEDLRGLSMTKEFRKSTSNIVGTDLSKYKLVYKYQFACDFMSVIRVHKLPVVLHSENFPIIVSPAYTVFEIIDKNELSPEYLMMWFRRSEFDRYADFRCDSAIRGGFKWDELCEVELPIPSIEKQRQIVAEYNAVDNRIRINEQLNQKLEETAQAIYKHWFVDFEFPYLTSSGVEMPYKSSGGAMVYNEELDKQIPEGWEVKSYTEMIKLTGGGTPKTHVDDYWNGEIPFFTPADISGNFYTNNTIKSITTLGLNNSSTKLYPKNTVFITARGTVGSITLSGCDMAMNQSCYAIQDDLPFYTHQLSLNVMQKLKGEATGAVFSALVTKDFDQQIIFEPLIQIKRVFNSLISFTYEMILEKIKENNKLLETKDLLLSKMSKVEVEKEMV